jgi:hypothetical protein
MRLACEKVYKNGHLHVKKKELEEPHGSRTNHLKRREEKRGCGNCGYRG